MAEMSQMLARVKREPFADLPIADRVNQLLKESGQVWRERLLPPVVMLRLFVIQILSGNCAIAALRQLVGFDFSPSSYCEARKRLPLQLLQSLLAWMNEHVEKSLETAPRLIGTHIYIADGSTHSMKDTSELHEHFHLPSGQKEGVGYPMGKIMGLLNAATGMFASLLGLPLFDHDMRSVISVHAMLAAGDILLGDRAFCSFAHIALLNARGVFACLRLHQRRKNTSRGLQRWKKPSKCPAWMSPEQFQLLPAWIDVRIVCHTIAKKGFRTQQVFIATTLLDEQQWPDEKIAELYGQRWQIETCFNHLKTTMNMNVLRCETVDGVMKELAVYLVVYNLIRLAMLKAARAQGVSVRRISFVDAMRFLLARILGLKGVSRLIINPDRKGRVQLRVIRRRAKQYDLLRIPRREQEKKNAEKAAKAAEKA
jgi:hypothetical protein